LVLALAARLEDDVEPSGVPALLPESCDSFQTEFHREVVGVLRICVFLP
jgi:hypothetical protein